MKSYTKPGTGFQVVWLFIILTSYWGEGCKEFFTFDILGFLDDIFDSSD